MTIPFFTSKSSAVGASQCAPSAGEAPRRGARRRCLYWIKLRDRFDDIGTRVRDQAVDRSGRSVTGWGTSILTERDAFMLSWAMALAPTGSRPHLLDHKAAEACGSGETSCVCLRKVWR